MGTGCEVCMGAGQPLWRRVECEWLLLPRIVCIGNRTLPKGKEKDILIMLRDIDDAPETSSCLTFPDAGRLG
jgi:hypothetical protein